MLQGVIKLSVVFSALPCIVSAQTFLEVPFYRGAIGESVLNSTAPLNLNTFSSLGIDRATISQAVLNGSTNFGDTTPQGNDRNVQLTFEYGNGNPSSTIDAIVNFRDGNTEAIGLITEPDSDGSYPDDNSGYTVSSGKRPVYLLQLATSTGTYQDGGGPLVNSNDANVQALAALNDYYDKIEAGLDPETGASGGGSCGQASNANILQCNPIDNSLGQSLTSIDFFRNHIGPANTTATQDGYNPDHIAVNTSGGLFMKNNSANKVVDGALNITNSEILNSHQWNIGKISSVTENLVTKHSYNKDNPSSDILVGDNVLNASTHGNFVDANSNVSGASSHRGQVAFLQENNGAVANNITGVQFRMSTMDGIGTGANDNINQVETITFSGNSSVSRARGNYVSYTLNVVE